MSIPESKLTKIEIEVRDYDNELVKMIEHIRALSSPGHSFIVVVDPDVTEKEGKRTFSMDGDGSFFIKNIKLNGKKLRVKDGKILENYLREL